MIFRVLFLYLFVAGSTQAVAQTIDFETTVPANWSTATGGTLSISDDHFRTGDNALRWDFSGGAVATIDTPDVNMSWVTSYYHHTTELWIYHEDATANDTLRFEFFSAANQRLFYFDFILNYEGWRRVARSYRYDMHAVGYGTPIDRIEIKASAGATGSVWFDDWEYVKGRYARFRSFQMPDVGGFLSNTSLLDAWQNPPTLPITPPTATELSELADIRMRVRQTMQGGGAPNPAGANAFHAGRDITVANGRISGRATTPQEAGNHILNLARHAHHTGDTASLRRVSELIWLVNDSGYAEGSDLSYGWYDTRNYFTGVTLIQTQLEPALADKVARAINWVFATGNYWLDDIPPALSADHVHTNLRFELANLVNDPDDARAVRNLRGWKRFYEAKNLPDTGSGGWLKPDHTGFHHGTHYFGYMYAYASYIDVLGLLDTTQFQIDQAAYEAFRDAVYAFFLFSNGNHYANSLSGRHPFSTNVAVGGGSLRKLALLGGQYYGTTTDPLMAGLYKRVFDANATGLGDVAAETFPTGFWQFNYSPAGVYRADDWTATLKGVSTSFWGTEIYATANRYGRYQSYGAVEIMYPGGRDASGMNRAGRDWNRPAGTTTKILPWEDLNPAPSRYDERAQSDYAVALRLGGSDRPLDGAEVGMYAFDFQQRAGDTRDTSFHFKKTMICFDGMIICLGSNIRCQDTAHPINTTIFQNHLSDNTAAISEDGAARSGVGYSSTLAAGEHLLIDHVGTGYYVKSDAPLEVRHQNLDSPDQSGNGTFNNGDISLAYLDHGAAPTDAGYEMVVLPGATHTDLQTLQTLQNTPGSERYRVREASARMHHVYLTNCGVDAYGVWRGSTTDTLATEGPVRMVSAPATLMTQTQGDSLTVSLVGVRSPNLQNSTIEVELRDDYVPVQTDAGVVVQSRVGERTRLSFQPRLGEPLDVVLLRRAVAAVGCVGVSLEGG